MEKGYDVPIDHWKASTGVQHVQETLTVGCLMFLKESGLENLSTQGTNKKETSAGDYCHPERKPRAGRVLSL